MNGRKIGNGSSHSSGIRERDTDNRWKHKRKRQRHAIDRSKESE